jgi:hypothetical protein
MVSPERQLSEFTHRLCCSVTKRCEAFGSAGPQQQRKTGSDYAPRHWRSLAAQADKADRDFLTVAPCRIAHVNPP